MIYSRIFFNVSSIGIIAVSILLLSILLNNSTAMLAISSIEGGVVEKTSGQPLAYCNIVIVAKDMGTMTKVDGSYRINGIPPGAYTVQAMMMGYETESVCRIEVGEGETVFLHFELEPIDIPTKEIIIGPCHPGSSLACTVHGVEFMDLTRIKLPVIDTAIFWDDAYEKARLEIFPKGDPFVINECLSQSTDSAFAPRCPECVKQARIWLDERD